MLNLHINGKIVNMNEQAAVILGASGLTGNHLLNEILKDEHFSSVKILVRTKLSINHPKLQQVIVDFNDLEDYRNKFGKGDCIFCCIGTTQRKVKGDKAAYEKTDRDIPLNAARIGVANGFKKFLVVSSAGADRSSSNFYLRLKGKTENDIKQFLFESISIFRPSMLLGKRYESRPGERIAQLVMQALSFLFVGPFKKYHPVNAKDVAKAMIAESKKTNPGIHILEYKEIMNSIK